MAYIRTKKINENKYGYLVESKNTEKGPRQKVKGYLGKVFELEKKGKVEVADTPGNDKKELLLSIMLPELQLRGFKKRSGKFCCNNIVLCPRTFSLSQKGKKVVLSLNGGYLCDFTLQRIIGFRKSKDFSRDGYTLAKYFLEAGLLISEDNFVRFYQMQ